ncbi:MAG: hypothetical protein JEZ09_17790 [Salinivirgaceae bacterium]|nr:hypothetical protein [Salinivirgaceae bacterium]
MIVKRIIEGHVTQLFNTEDNGFISQEFTAGCNVEIEPHGNIAVNDDQRQQALNAYIPFDMMQPSKTITEGNRIVIEQPAMLSILNEYVNNIDGDAIEHFARTVFGIGFFVVQGNQSVDVFVDGGTGNVVIMGDSALTLFPKEIIDNYGLKLVDDYGNEVAVGEDYLPITEPVVPDTIKSIENPPFADPATFLELVKIYPNTNIFPGTVKPIYRTVEQVEILGKRVLLNKMERFIQYHIEDTSKIATVVVEDSTSNQSTVSDHETAMAALRSVNINA